MSQSPHARRFCNLTGRIFVVGVGAQKAGTTWLYDFLGRHAQVAISPIKELHYFDVVHRPDLCGFWSEHFRRDMVGLLRSLASGGTASTLQLHNLMDRVRMDSDAHAYLEYFDRLATYGRRVVGEITPSYSIMPETGFADMRDMISASGAKPRIIFIMRDPAERFWSQCRMRAALKEEERTAAQICDDSLRDPGFVDRGRYDWTIARLQRVFPGESLLFLFYEDMFQDASIKRICDFLEIGYAPPDFTREINKSPEAALDPARRSRITEVFSPVYDFVDAEFGEAVPPAWHSDRPAENSAARQT